MKEEWIQLLKLNLKINKFFWEARESFIAIVLWKYDFSNPFIPRLKKKIFEVNHKGLHFLTLTSPCSL